MATCGTTRSLGLDLDVDKVHMVLASPRELPRGGVRGRRTVPPPDEAGGRGPASFQAGTGDDP